MPGKHFARLGLEEGNQIECFHVVVVFGSFSIAQTAHIRHRRQHIDAMSRRSVWMNIEDLPGSLRRQALGDGIQNAVEDLSDAHIPSIADLAVEARRWSGRSSDGSRGRRARQRGEARGLSLADVAERSGIDKSRLSKLENDPRANPTLATLTRIASAMGVKLSIHVDVA